MAAYSTGGKVVTGRTANNGDYCHASVVAKAVSEKLCAGWATYSGIKTFSIVPIYTWAEYPTGIIDIPISSGNPTSGADANIYASYTDNWVNWSNLIVPPVNTIHGVELRYYCLLYSSSTRMIVWLSTGGGYSHYDSPPPPPGPQWHADYPNPNIDLSADFEMTLDVGCKERVEINQLLGGSSEWVWPTGCFKDGMGTTEAIFDAIAEESTCTITIGGDTVTLPTDYITGGSYTFDSSRTIEGKVGSYTSAINKFGWGNLTWQYPGIYTMDGSDVFGALTEIGNMTLGVKEMDLRLRQGQSYQGTDTNCEGNAAANSINYKARYSPASASGATVYTHAKWTDLGLTYKQIVDFMMMDGAAQSDTPTTPEFVDSTSIDNHSWTGSDSGLITYSGAWELKMYELDGSIMDNYTPTTTDHSGTGASWALTDSAPTYINAPLLSNPEDYNTMGTSVYDPDTNTTTTYDDKRCQFVYPREETGVSYTMASILTMDALDTVGTLGVAGWNANLCSLAASGGDLVVTNAGTGAYIYRSDFMTSSDIRKPKHWPPHRFAHIEAVCMDATPTTVPFGLSLTVKRTGGADTMEKVYTNFVTTVTGGLFDTCKPDGSGGSDTSESYIDLAQPLDTAWVSGSKQSNELSALSWSWGIGAFDKVEIGGFAAGNTYTLKGLTTRYTSETWGSYSLVQPECDAKRYTGVTVLNADPMDNIQLYLWRHCIGVVNGKYGFEVPSTKLSITGSGVESYENLTVKEAFAAGATYLFPADDYSAFTWTIPADDDPADWDGTEWANEDHIFAGDTCPIWFLLEKPQGTEHDNAASRTIMASPRYDRITVYPSWGDGTGVTARTGYVTLKSIKRVRGRVNGIYWDDYAYGVDTVDVESAYSETLNTDELGYYRSGDHNKPTTITKGTYDITIQPKNRVWSRVCFSLPNGAFFLNACSSKQTGRTYVVYSLGLSLKVRIFDYGNKGYTDRDIKTYTTDTSCGICYTAGRSAGLVVVYEKDGTIYRTASDSECKDWITAVSIGTGTYPQCCYDQTTRNEITTYYSGGNAYAIIKKGEGDYGSPITIATADEAPVGIAVLIGTREHKLMAGVVQSGAIVRYVSKDDGKTWTVEE